MSDTITDNRKRRGRPKTGATLVGVRMERDLLHGIDAFAADETDSPSRPEALRRILRDWLIGHGYMQEPK